MRIQSFMSGYWGTTSQIEFVKLRPLTAQRQI